MKVNVTKFMKDLLKSNGVKETNINRLLVSLKNDELSHKEKCESINRSGISYGQLRCSCPSLLQEVLGFDLEELVSWWNITTMINPNQCSDEWFVSSYFTINHIKDGKVDDWGFFGSKKLPSDYSFDVVDYTDEDIKEITTPHPIHSVMNAKPMMLFGV